ncbi:MULTISPECIES: hypothetical protein [Pseudomonas]|uniref:Secreted protein n=1 Tax=Pseudomonas delhiensis TaxID=366289 RepID=A0A239MSJ7_9PSED|nr:MULTISPECIES: hypothetical protein [Pseudomonas]MED5609387.1 hypothetical protein [Pseudomonas sp. JH-2]SDK22037.1 hypothetical protein SAMN05216189_103219 [Pseudomonas delhiensis]SNT45655.1 hypothetical protein SAMN06295949_13018 [Pseudomonas delhiensis]
MSRKLVVAALLSVCSLSFVQLSFAEESRLMTDKMVKANEAAIAAAQQASDAERTAGKAAAQPNADS